MPVKLKPMNGKWRVVESTGKIARNKGGKPLDGGGHDSKKKALAQVGAVNRNLNA